VVTLMGVTYILTLASGIWLSSSGKPWSQALFTIHKLIALAAVIVIGVQLYRILRNAEAPALAVGAIVAAGMCFLSLFATGALMSAGKLSQGVMLTIHRIAPVPAILAIGCTLYLLSRNG
jgi:hypothetical protein